LWRKLDFDEAIFTVHYCSTEPFERFRAAKEGERSRDVEDGWIEEPYIDELEARGI